MCDSTERSSLMEGLHMKLFELSVRVCQRHWHHTSLN